MYVDCKRCADLNRPEAAGRGAAVVLTFNETDERIYLCGVCADQWDRARAFSGNKSNEGDNDG